MKKVILTFILAFLASMMYSQAWMEFLPKNKKESALTFYDYKNAFNQWCLDWKIDHEGYFINKNGERQKAYGWKQFKRWEIEVEGTYDRNTGRFLDEVIGREINNYYNEIQSNRNIGGNWTSLAYSNEGIGNDGNGRINCVAFHPTDPNTFWIGAAWGGIWSTTDHGATWTPLSDFIKAIGIGSIGIPYDYSTSHTIYLGTGDRGSIRDRGIGLLKSTNSGLTWENTGLVIPEPESFYITRILIHPFNSSIIYAGSTRGLFKSLDAGDTWDTLNLNRIADMEFKTDNSQTIYAGTRHTPGDDSTRIIVSIDGGLNWDTIFTVRGNRTELAVSADDPDVLYGISGAHGGAMKAIAKSNDAGQTAVMILNGDLPGNNLTVGCDPDGEGGQSHYDLAIAADPENADVVYIGGIEAWKSSNGGDTWQLNTDGYGRCSGINHNVHVDQHYHAFQPVTNDFFICSDGGIYYSANDGVSYTNISGGLAINQPYRIGCTYMPGEILMGQQDNGIVLFSDGDVNFVGGGDGGTAVINPEAPFEQYFTNNSRTITGTINHWMTRFYFNPVNDSSDNWFKPIIVLPPDTVLVGYTDLWRSHDNGQTLYKVHDFDEPGHINDIAVAPSNHNVMVVDFNTHIYKTNDGGDTWVNMSGNWEILPENCYRTVFKHDDPEVMWITDTRWDNGISVARSEDGGLTWDDISEGLPDASWYDLIQNKNQTNYEEIYVCGFFGTWLKLGDNPWVPFNNGLPNVISFDMDAHYGYTSSKLRTGTHGRGVWETDFYSAEAIMPGIWTGVQSSDWHDNRNWQYLEVPSASEVVTIPAGCPNNPHIYLGNASCTNITIDSGAVVTLSARRIYISENAAIDGKIKMLGTGPGIIVTDDLTWSDDAAFENLGTGSFFDVTGNLMFETGCDVNLTGSSTRFKGSTSSVLYNYSADCMLGDVSIDKISSSTLFFDASSSEDITINGNFTINSISKFTQHAERQVILNGNLDVQGNFYQQHGAINCQSSGTLNFASPTSFFNDLILDPGNFTNVLSNIEVRGNLNIIDGLMNIFEHTVELKGDLESSYLGSVTMTSGKIVFNSSDEQKLDAYIELTNVELNKPSDTLRFMGNKVVSFGNFDYTSGALALESGSVLNIDELVDDGICGTYCVKSGATLNITNPTGSVDLNGKLIISGGNVNVFGGNHASYWPGSANAELNMSSGTLDFKDRGIFLLNHPSLTLTDNITGGTIRTISSFQGDHTSFNPAGGTIELYGTDNAELSHGPGSSFYNVIINKGATTAMQGINEVTELNDEANPFVTGKVSRNDEKPLQRKALPPSGTRANKVTVLSNLDIDGNIEIESGILDINGYTVDVGQSLDITGTLNILNSSSVLNVNSNVTWRPGSASNITAGMITFKSIWTFMNGTNASFGGSNTVKAMGSSLTYIYHKDPDASFAILVVDKSGSALYLDDVSAYPLRVSGNLSVKTGNSLQVRAADVIVDGLFTAHTGSTIGILAGGAINASNAAIDNSFNLVNGSSFESANMTVNGTFTLTDGGTVNADDLSLYGVFDVNAGSVLVHNSLYQAPASTLTIDGGSFIIDKSYTGNFMSFSGTTNLNGGFFEISHESIQFGTGAVVNILGGNLRVGGHFRAIAADSFKPDYGAVELINTIGATIECSNGNYFHELIINKNAGSNPCMLAYPTTINTNLMISSGELSTMNYTLNINEDLTIQPNGKLTAGSSTINVGDDWINNRGTNGFAEGTSSVWLVSGQPCQISSETFYNLDLDKNLAFNQFANMASGSVMTVLNKLTLGNGTLRMNNNCTLNLNGDLHLKAGGGLNANAIATGTVINVFGQWDDYNPVWSNMIGFASGQSTVNFIGSQAQELTASGGANFYNLVLQKTNNAFTPFNNISVVNDFNLVSGEWRQNEIDLTFTFKGNFTIADASLWLDSVNTILFKGESSQVLTNSGQGWLTCGNLEVNRSVTGNLSLLSDVNCSDRFIISSGEVIADSYRLMSQHGFDIESDGTLNLLNSVIAALGNDGSFHINGGELNLLGTPSDRVLVTRIDAGYYEMLVENGGSISAEYTDFEYINGRGLNIYTDGTVSGAQPFNFCSFQKTESLGTLLQINNDQNITFYNVDFPTNTWSGESNVKKQNDAGNIYMVQATGNFAGPGFENDFFSRIHWPSTGVWEGDVSSDWHNAQNWLYNFQVPDASTDVEIPSGKPNYPVLSSQAVLVKTLKMETGTSLAIPGNNFYIENWADIRGSLSLGDFVEDQIEFWADSIDWKAGSSANVVGKGFFVVGKDIVIRQGTNLEMTNGEFVFQGIGESKLVCFDTAQIHNLTNNKSAPYSLSLCGDTLARLTIGGSFVNGTGATLKCPSTQEWVFDGNFKNAANGHLRLSNGTVRLSGPISTNNFRVKQGDYFNNLVIDTLVNLYTIAGYSDTLRVNGDLIFAPNNGSTSRLTANTFKIMLRGDWINNAGAAAFVTGAGQSHQVHFWDPGQRQEIRGNSNFNGVFVYNESEDGAHFYDVVNVSSLFVINPLYSHGNMTVQYANIDDNLSAIHLVDGSVIQINSLYQGGIIHVHDGSLTVEDLSQNYVTGSYIIDNGLMILKQTEYTTTHDLFYANLEINGGELRFFGGNGQSDWPSVPTANSNVTMTGGLFYLLNHNIEIMPGSFSENISGGTIRLPGNFIADAGVTSFHPTGGIVELYDDWDVDCGFLEPQCWFHNLYVNKSGEASVVPFYGIRVKDELKLVQGNLQLYGNPVIVGP